MCGVTTCDRSTTRSGAGGVVAAPEDPAATNTAEANMSRITRTVLRARFIDLTSIGGSRTGISDAVSSTIGKTTDSQAPHQLRPRFRGYSPIAAAPTTV